MSQDDLFEAIEAGDAGAVRALLAEGADANLKHGILETPALVEAAEDSNLDAVTPLIEAGAHFNAADYGGHTPLLHAARRANVDVVRALPDAGAEPNRSDDASKWTALSWAVWWSCQIAGDPIRPNYEEAVRVLL